MQVIAESVRNPEITEELQAATTQAQTQVIAEPVQDRKITEELQAAVTQVQTQAVTETAQEEKRESMLPETVLTKAEARRNLAIYR